MNKINQIAYCIVQFGALIALMVTIVNNRIDLSQAILLVSISHSCFTYVYFNLVYTRWKNENRSI